MNAWKQDVNGGLMEQNDVLLHLFLVAWKKYSK
jgi:hypothetical protein